MWRGLLTLACLCLVTGCNIEERLGYKPGSSPPSANNPVRPPGEVGGQTPEGGSRVGVPSRAVITGRFSSPLALAPEPVTEDDAFQVANGSANVTIQATGSSGLGRPLNFETGRMVRGSVSLTECSYQSIIMNDLKVVTVAFGGNTKACRESLARIASSGIELEFENVGLADSGEIVKSVTLRLLP